MYIDCVDRENVLLFIFSCLSIHNLLYVHPIQLPIFTIYYFLYHY